MWTCWALQPQVCKFSENSSFMYTLYTGSKSLNLLKTCQGKLRLKQVKHLATLDLSAPALTPPGESTNQALTVSKALLPTQQHSSLSDAAQYIASCAVETIKTKMPCCWIQPSTLPLPC